VFEVERSDESLRILDVAAILDHVSFLNVAGGKKQKRIFNS